jgi:hypothetical protein
MEAECSRETGKYGKAEAEGVYRDHNSMGSTRILTDNRLGGQEEARRYRIVVDIRRSNNQPEKSTSHFYRAVTQ